MLIVSSAVIFYSLSIFLCVFDYVQFNFFFSFVLQHLLPLKWSVHWSRLEMARKSSPVSVLGGFLIVLVWLITYEGMLNISVRGVKQDWTFLKLRWRCSTRMPCPYLHYHLSYPLQTKRGSLSSLTEVYQTLTFCIISRLEFSKLIYQIFFSWQFFLVI